ncbi:MAG: class I SAM-dependent methyltransferase [Sphingomonadales bacterium]|jgi:ubiquinone/menaquinone biosynthesis C-methylase UbiE
MSRLGEKAVYHLSQSARVGFFLGNRLLSNRLSGPVVALDKASGPIPSLADLLADMRILMQEDLANVQKGLYPMPLDGLTSPMTSLRQMVRYFADLPAIHRRRKAKLHQEITPEGGLEFPRYYLQNFHYQSDGWLSDASAQRYDYQVEVVFLGAADAMRRQLLGELVQWARGKNEPVKIADLACGTGRFLHQIRSALPGAKLHGVDLSPYYIERGKKRFIGDRNTVLEISALEALSLGDESFDALSCIFTFHELPPKIRVQAAKEIARVLKPGGRYFHMDSVQKGDHAPYEALLDLFPDAFHEPYYKSYVNTDLQALFEGAGLVLKQQSRAFFSKLSVFEKPLT